MILVDTQSVLWLTLERDKLSQRAAQALADAASMDGIAIASTTLWEVAMAVSRGRVTLPSTINDYLAMLEKRFRSLPITAAIAERSVQFGRKYPKDPSDRIIGATAIVNGLRLVSADSKIRKSGEVDCIW